MPATWGHRGWNLPNPSGTAQWSYTADWSTGFVIGLLGSQPPVAGDRILLVTAVYGVVSTSADNSVTMMSAGWNQVGPIVNNTNTSGSVQYRQAVWERPWEPGLTEATIRYGARWTSPASTIQGRAFLYSILVRGCGSILDAASAVINGTGVDPALSPPAESSCLSIWSTNPSVEPMNNGWVDVLTPYGIDFGPAWAAKQPAGPGTITPLSRTGNKRRQVHVIAFRYVPDPPTAGGIYVGMPIGGAGLVVSN